MQVWSAAVVGFLSLIALWLVVNHFQGRHCLKAALILLFVGLAVLAAYAMP
jgi:hypothetical protein